MNIYFDDKHIIDFKEAFELLKLYCDKSVFDNIDISHIIYDELLDIDNVFPINPNDDRKNCDFRIIRGCNHDGTLIFVHEAICNALFPLINRTCTILDKDVPPDLYKIGKIIIQNIDTDITNEYNVRLFHKTIVSIPVKCIFN